MAAEAVIRFNTLRLDRSPAAGVEWISSPAVFTDAAFFHGHLFLAGPTGLTEFDPTGKTLASYRAGWQLPAAPLVSLATGVARDSAEPELFVATAGAGLLAFDGTGFRQILPAQAPYRDLTAVLPLSAGRILLGTAKKGVLAYDGKHISPFHALLTDLQVTTLAGAESNIWVGTLNQGVMHWHAGQVERFGEAEGLPDPQVLSLAVAGEKAFAGTPMGVAEFADGRFNRVLAGGFFARSLLVRGETLEIGTMEEGTAEVPLTAGRAWSGRPRGRNFSGQVQRLLDQDGTLYALAEDGFYSSDERSGGWRRVAGRETALLADRNVSALAFDSAGRLWVGYFDRGLDIIEPGGDRASHLENDHIFCVNRIAYDAEHNGAVVATANGLVLFDAAARERQVLGRSDGLIADHVTDVSLHPGGMTIATPAGLTLLNASGMRSLYAFHGLVNNHVYAVAASGDRVMVGTLGGLSILEGGQVRASFTTANSGLRHNWITAIVPVGDDWFVGTYGAGILRFDSAGRWQTFTDASAPVSVNPNAMLVSEGRVYAGTLGKGLLVFDRASARWTARVAGLPSSNVTAIALHDGYVYVGTDNGLIRIAEQNLETR